MRGSWAPGDRGCPAWKHNATLRTSWTTSSTRQKHISLTRQLLWDFFFFCMDYLHAKLACTSWLSHLLTLELTCSPSLRQFLSFRLAWQIHSSVSQMKWNADTAEAIVKSNQPGKLDSELAEGLNQVFKKRSWEKRSSVLHFGSARGPWSRSVQGFLHNSFSDFSWPHDSIGWTCWL